MKFGVLLDDHLFPEWRFYYLYASLLNVLLLVETTQFDGPKKQVLEECRKSVVEVEKRGGRRRRR